MVQFTIDVLVQIVEILLFLVNILVLVLLYRQIKLQKEAMERQKGVIAMNTYNEMFKSYAHLLELQISYKEIEDGWKKWEAPSGFCKMPSSARNKYRLVRLAFDLFERAYLLTQNDFDWIKNDWENRWVPLVKAWCAHEMFENVWNDCKQARLYSETFINYVEAQLDGTAQYQ
ncbi:MAG: hypothetical protein D6681_08930 [Calditrichaeota bacterium]|nr:MAG: hypothetical protein D6681_08930 [Calditrichota bacterium]